ncbi:hypothetical protein C8N28_1133 [Albibacterium bauzanense]|uniref:Stationary phase survival protein SurE n=1 Tax=Albibacterium bauzanense TaxID=653929 RepID=A0A4R1M1G7_9SPHI|nr:hypothetical protein C8N28_1133 [Albibacterium bauzanense]
MKINNFIIGSVIGAVVPMIVYLLIQFNSGNFINNKPFALYGLAVLLNLLIMRYFFHFELTRSAQGVIFITFVITMALLFSGSFKIDM